MKKILTLFVLTVILIACSDDDEQKKEIKTTTFKSHNIKTNGKQYFSFAINSVTNEEPAIWDIAFGSVPLTVETAPCQFFTMPNDPVIFAGTDLKIAKVDAVSLDDVTTIPGASVFKEDITEGNPVIGENWVDASFDIKPDTYIIKTCGGNFGIIQLSAYQYESSKHQVYDIEFDFKYNNDGSLDFTSSTLSSVTVPDANTNMQYFSFENGIVTSHDAFDVKFNGYSIWTGLNVTVKKMENTDIEDVTAISDSGLSADELPSFVTTGWYDYGEGHVISARDHVYIVNTPDGKYPAFEITNYYDAQGESGTFTIEWKYLKE